MNQAGLDKHTPMLIGLWDLGFNTISKLQIVVDILLEIQESFGELKYLSDGEKMKLNLVLNKLANADTCETLLPRPPFKITALGKNGTINQSLQMPQL